ncbi:MAG TPA: hypothetical protein VFS27_04785 [Blastocatellia bacterium]|jgi:hypothetical protein|nr:hypothetical protein [Blastocatellia bacterium]
MRRNIKTAFAASICLIALAAFAISTSGQSGRRQKKSAPQPPVQGVNQPEARTVPEPEVSPDKPKEKEPQRAVMVSTAMADIGISSFYPDAARRGCMDEFHRAMRSLDVREARDQHRSDAMKVAKESEQTYVVWMEFQVDQMGTSNYGFDLRYTIFEPKTAKVVGTGSGYPQQPSGPISLPPVGGARTDVYADWAGRDVARQAMKRLGWVR